MFPKWTPSPGVRGCSRGKNLTGFRITGISQIKDFGADPVLTQIPSSSMGSRQGRTPTVKWGSQELIQGRESGQHTKREFQLQGLYRFFKMQKNGGKAGKSRAERREN